MDGYLELFWRTGHPVFYLAGAERDDAAAASEGEAPA